MVVIFIGAGLLVFGGAAVVFGVANARGRDGSVWALLSLALAVAIGWFCSSVFLSGEASNLDSDAALWMAVLPPVAVVAVHVAVSAVVLALPLVGSQARGSSWEMDVLGTTRETKAAVVKLAKDRLTIVTGDVTRTVALRDLLEARADGETLVIAWQDEDDKSVLTLLPRGAESRKARSSFCESLARRLNDQQ